MLAISQVLILSSGGSLLIVTGECEMRHKPRRAYDARDRRAELYATLLSLAALSFIVGVMAGFLLLQL
jgi:hypothetical protein